MKAAKTPEYSNIVNEKEFRQNWMREIKQPCKNKRMCGQFKENCQKKKEQKETWSWQIKANLKVETEAMVSAAKTGNSNVKHKIDNTAQSPLCRMCNKKCEIISHIVRE